MEPDIIRMYSSSPPPLDNGADDDDEDEFGEFGGFSGVNTASVAFADFDAPEYSHPKEEFISTNHFIPLCDYSDNVASIATFTSVKNVKDCIAELPTHSKEVSDMSATSTSKEKSKSGTSGTALEDAKKRGEQGVNTGKSEGISSCFVRVGTAVEPADACNGEKLPCLEILTNGFAAPDPANPKGTEDLDYISGSKGLKTGSAHSTEQNLNSMLSSGENFADFATFSNKTQIHLEGIGPTICSVPTERDSLSIQENNRLNRVTHLCFSEISCEQGPLALEDNEFAISSMSQTTGSSVCTTENGEHSGRSQCSIENGKDFTRHDDSLGNEDSKVDEIQRLATEKFSGSEDLKNGGSRSEVEACNDTQDDDFGDFGSVSNVSPTFMNAQELVNAADLEGTSQQPAHVSKPKDEFSEFRDTSTEVQQPACLEQAELNQTADTLECHTTQKTSGTDLQCTTELENGDSGEFGDFDSVPKPQDESLAFQDSDDFADFSSAGCNQAADWNAFEDEQKDSCPWAAFADEQAGESHHRKEMWQSHRTDASASIDGPVLHKTDSFASASFQGTTSKQSQEPAPSAQ
ncbi:AFTIN protein, partial [Rhinopomastus cyanomelas]|nr:AFTIN protein [Rhinopomastus cyanomelas]